MGEHEVFSESSTAHLTVREICTVNVASGKPVMFHVVSTKHGNAGAVCMATKRTDTGEYAILLGRHWRPSVNQWGWELPRGMGEDGETPCQTAVRELQEETGIVAEAAQARIMQYMHADTGVLRDNIAVVHIPVPQDAQCTQQHDWELRYMDWFPLTEICDAVAHDGLQDGITLAALMVFNSQQRCGAL